MRRATRPPVRRTLDVSFRIEPARIEFLADHLGHRFGPRLVSEAWKFRLRVEQDWKTYRRFALQPLSVLGQERFAAKVVVSLLPPRFRIGAVEPTSALILFGQPLRCRGFATAIFAHELAHMILAGGPEQGVMLGEIVALLAEAHVYRSAAGKTLADVWKGADLDAFHAGAIAVAVKLEPELDWSSLSFCELIEKVDRHLPAAMRSLAPPKGLLRNIGRDPRKEIGPIA